MNESKFYIATIIILCILFMINLINFFRHYISRKQNALRIKNAQKNILFHVKILEEEYVSPKTLQSDKNNMFSATKMKNSGNNFDYSTIVIYHYAEKALWFIRT